METFLDGGVFEMIIAFVFAVTLNFIFIRKYLLLIFSLVIIVCPVLLFFVNEQELRAWLVVISIFNSVLLVCLLWKTKKDHPQEPLFKVDFLKEQLTKVKLRTHKFFQKSKL